MGNNITELVLILDESGSMNELRDDTIGGFNSLIEDRKNDGTKTFVSTVFFNNESKVIHDRIEIGEVGKLTKKDYRPSGSTALIDALGGAIRHIGNIHKYARKEDIPEHTLFVITTDGMENSSHIYTSSKVKKMIEKRKKKDGWEFVFMGANIDAVETAKSYGISEDKAINYCSDSIGTMKAFDTMKKACRAMVSSPVCFESAKWREDIDADYIERKV